MTEIKLGVCFLDKDNKVISKRVVGTNWTVDIEQDLKGKFDKCMKEEASIILLENLKLQLEKDIIGSMLDEIKEGSV